MTPPYPDATEADFEIRSALADFRLRVYQRTGLVVRDAEIAVMWRSLTGQHFDDQQFDISEMEVEGNG